VSRGRTVALAAGTAALLIALDQLTKALVRRDIAPGESVRITGFLHLAQVHNRGIAFGLASQSGALVAVVAAVILLGLLAFFAANLGRRLIWLPTGMLVAGAVGNLVDRARQGYVTDFVQLPHWPAFNLADASITLGVVVLIWALEGLGRRGRA
jgi:signal peptidase II